MQKLQGKKALISALSLGLIFGATNAAAYEQGDVFIRVGAATVAPQDDSSATNLNDKDVAGSSVTVDNNTQFGITFTYMLTNNLALNVLGATPFSHEVTAKNLPLSASDIKIAEVKHLPPTVTMQFYPMDSSSPLQPYVGLGFNYTRFFDEELTSDFETAIGSTGKIELDDSFGYALEAGVNYNINENFMLSASVWAVGLETSATIYLPNTKNAPSTAKVDVDIDPMVYMVGLGYKF